MASPEVIAMLPGACGLREHAASASNNGISKVMIRVISHKITYFPPISRQNLLTLQKIIT